MVIFSLLPGAKTCQPWGKNRPGAQLTKSLVPVQTNAVRNLGVMFDCNMSMSAQVNNVVKSANYHLINIGRARKMLTTESTKMAVHALVTSRIDYCNSLLAGISESLLKRLVNIQRTAARIVTRKRKYDPISHDLVELHWLPIKQRIDFKIIVLVYKCLHQSAPNYLAELLHVSIPSSSSLKFNCFLQTH